MSPPKTRTQNKARGPRAVPAAPGPNKNETSIPTDTSCEEDPCADSLLLAVAKQSLENVAGFIADGHDLQDTPVKGCSPLLLAVKLQNCEIVKLLVENGASCCDADGNGLTVLHHAAVNGLADVVSCLVVVGNALLDQRNLAGCTPLYQAVQYGHVDCAGALLALGASLESRTRSGATPLYIASDRGHLSLVNLLLDAGADATVATELQMTPLLVAAFNGHRDVLLSLLSHKVDIEQCGPCGGTALYVAAQEGRSSVAECLLHEGAKVDARCHGDLSPSLIAAMQGHDSLMRLLLEARGDLSVRSEKGSTLAIMAARFGRTDCLKTLVEFGGPQVLEGENTEGVSALGASKLGRHNPATSYIKSVFAAQKEADLNAWEASLPSLLKDLDPPSKKKKKGKSKQGGKMNGRRVSEKIGVATDACSDSEPVVARMVDATNAEADDANEVFPAVDEDIETRADKENVGGPWMQVSRKGVVKPMTEIAPPGSPAQLPQGQPMPMLSPIGTLSTPGPGTPMSAQSSTKHESKQAGKMNGRRVSEKIGVATDACSDSEPVVARMVDATNAEADDANQVFHAVDEHTETRADKESGGGPWMQLSRKGGVKPMIAIAPPGSPAHLPQGQPVPMLSPIGTLSTTGPGTPMSAQSSTNHETTSPFGPLAVLPAWPSTPEFWPHVDPGLGANYFWPTLLPPPAMSLDHTPEKVTSGGNLRSNFVNSAFSMTGHCQSVYVAPLLPQNYLIGNFISTGTYTGGELD